MELKTKYVDKIVFDYTTSPKSRRWEKLKPTAQVSHDTGNPGSTAKGNCTYMKSTSKDSSSAHTFIDDKEIRICIPLDEKAWHVLYNKPIDNTIWGDDANDIALGHELCFGDQIDFEKAYDMYVWMHVYCAKKFNIPIKRIEGHYKLDPERRNDPINAFKRYGKTWTGFLHDVQTYYDAWEESTPPKAPHTDELVHTVVSGDTLWTIAREHDTTVDNIRSLNPGIDENKLTIGSKVTVKKQKNDAKKVDQPAEVTAVKTSANPYAGKKIRSKVASLNFYDTPRWTNPSGQIAKGIGFPTIVKKVKVDGGYMYQVKNSKGQTYYVTASEKYVEIVKK